MLQDLCCSVRRKQAYREKVQTFFPCTNFKFNLKFGEK